MYNQPKTLLEQQCITFCAILKAMQGHLTADNVLSVADKVWKWTEETLKHAVSPSPAETPETPTVEAPPAQNGTQETVYYISEPQRRRLYAIAKGADIDKEKLEEFLRIEYDLDSTTKIRRDQYEGICEVVKTGELPF